MSSELPSSARLRCQRRVRSIDARSIVCAAVRVDLAREREVCAGQTRRSNERRTEDVAVVVPAVAGHAVAEAGAREVDGGLASVALRVGVGLPGEPMRADKTTHEDAPGHLAALAADDADDVEALEAVLGRAEG